MLSEKIDFSIKNSGTSQNYSHIKDIKDNFFLEVVE